MVHRLSPALPERLLARRFLIASLQMRAAARLAEAKFNPNQPRVPAGNPDGGQWTDAGGGSSRGGRSYGSRAHRERIAREAEAPADWRLVRREVLIDGSGERSLHEASDGTRILSERRTGLISGRQSTRHIVKMPDGSSLRVDNGRDGIQRIYDADGALLSASRWGRYGPETVAVRQLALSDGHKPRLPGGKVGLALRGAISLWNLLNRQVQNGKTPIIVARPREYSRSADGEIVPELVGEIDRDKADEFCKRYPEVRHKLSEIARRTRFGFRGTSREFGSLVHHRMARYVNDQENRDFRAEVTNATPDKSNPMSRHRYKGSTFLDVYERASRDTVCVYDHKTGRAGLSGRRATRLAATAFKIHPGAKRALIIEVRPGL